MTIKDFDIAPEVKERWRKGETIFPEMRDPYPEEESLMKKIMDVIIKWRKDSNG